MEKAQWPEWAEKLKRSYLAGSASVFILNGNVSDVVGSVSGDQYVTEPLADFMARSLFGAYDLVLHYDMGRGLRPHPAGDPKRLTRMNSTLIRLLGNDAELPRDPTQSLRVIDRLVSLLLVSEDSRASKTAVLFDYADFICPADDRAGEHLATFLNWARSPVIRRVNIIFVLMTESLSRLNPALVQSGHTEEIFLPLPSQAEREEFVRRQFQRDAAEAARLGTMSAGLTLGNLDNMMRLLALRNAPAEAGAKAAEPDTSTEGVVKSTGPAAPPAQTAARAQNDSTSDAYLTEIKKNLMEAQCPGLIEFVKPNLDLGMVAGHTAAKERLSSDARLVREGKLDAVPMGYLLCGPVGVGKTFLAMCYAGAIGIPCVTIRNFRSKYVGETEANLERILFVLRELGPVAVIIDEADAAVGDRAASGDSGTSARVFAQLASQMGNTQYRGKVIWFMLTCRPDLLPIDLKRQGRCEEHIPLFYPQTPDELKEMFLSMAKKAKVKLDASALPDLTKVQSLSGADIEGVLTRARRESLLRDKPVDAALISEVLENFRSARGPAHELQTLAAVLECSDMRYLPPKIRADAEKPDAMSVYARRLRELQSLEDRD
ncbi:MAG: AAA family ATPase [Candidatus Hydrogenedentes bacterium]|nr:AAA family ATPase [Candidatus Hydrogenedentota bacterium]